MVFIGPGDLCTDMGLVKEHGLPACFGTPEFAAAQKTIAETAKKHGVIAGFWNDDIADKAAKGFRFMVVDGDIHAMQAALAKSLAEKREAMVTAGVAGAGAMVCKAAGA